jgi:hypothetical protein
VAFFSFFRCWLRGHEDVHRADAEKRRRWLHCLRCGRNSAGWNLNADVIGRDQHTSARRRWLRRMQRRTLRHV